MSRIVRALRHNGKGNGGEGAKQEEYNSTASSATLYSTEHGDAEGPGGQMIWEEAVDPEFNRVYYHNKIDKRSTWSRPDLNQAVLQLQSQGGLDRNQPHQQQQYEAHHRHQHQQQQQPQYSQHQHQHHQHPQPQQQQRQRIGDGSGGDDQVWLEAFDPTFSRPYYFETQNKRSTWTRPQLTQFLDTHRPHQRQQQQQQQQPMQTLQEHSQSITEVSTSPIHHSDDNGKISSTHERAQRKESRRNRKHKKSVTSIESVRQIVREEEQQEWIRHWDDTHQRKYYYCPDTKQSSWKKPKGPNVVITKSDSRRGRAATGSIHVDSNTNGSSSRGKPHRSRMQKQQQQQEKLLKEEETTWLFAKGSTVEVFGLRSSDSLNGMHGKVLNSLAGRNRTVVRIGGKKLSLRNTNLCAVTADTAPPSFREEAEEEEVDNDSQSTKQVPSTSSRTTSADTAGVIDPSIAKFVKLLRRGIPRTAIEFQMKQAGLDPSLLPRSSDDSSAAAPSAPTIVLAPAPPSTALPKESSENVAQLPSSRHMPAQSSDAMMLFNDNTEPQAEPCTKTIKRREALQMNLSEQLGSIKLRKTKSEGGADLRERLAGGSRKSKGGGMSWLDSLRTNPKFQLIRKASLSLKAEEESRERSESLTHAFQ